MAGRPAKKYHLSIRDHIQMFFFVFKTQMTFKRMEKKNCLNGK